MEIYILAGNYEQARDYAKSKGLLPKDWQFIYPNHAISARGGKAILVGTWYDRKDGFETERGLKARGFTVEGE